ncbi:hypothetical protein ATN83_1747 [Raoultella ornithinolytica]|nr:hypothetical protein ATN83_1747 [Raoultella ornithinolytica]KDV92980.1 hypothetical protein AB00_3144 [Raoultella ornithinolytica 2-156-04_S1_C1]KDX13225.1 hypothetical protein AB28_3152 [Raoultella ornithinolytica 2-156-04_S1_C2]
MVLNDVSLKQKNNRHFKKASASFYFFRPRILQHLLAK